SKVSVIGTGFIVDERGLVMTAAHVLRPWQETFEAHGVINEVPSVFILSDPQFDGTAFRSGYYSAPLESLRLSNSHDVAVATILMKGAGPQPPELHPLTFSAQPCVEGDEVAVCGFP